MPTPSNNIDGVVSVTSEVTANYTLVLPSNQITVDYTLQDPSNQVTGDYTLVIPGNQVTTDYTLQDPSNQVTGNYTLQAPSNQVTTNYTLQLPSNQVTAGYTLVVPGNQATINYTLQLRSNNVTADYTLNNTVTINYTLQLPSNQVLGQYDLVDTSGTNFVSGTVQVYQEVINIFEPTAVLGPSNNISGVVRVYQEVSDTYIYKPVTINYTLHDRLRCTLQNFKLLPELPPPLVDDAKTTLLATTAELSDQMTAEYKSRFRPKTTSQLLTEYRAADVFKVNDDLIDDIALYKGYLQRKGTLDDLLRYVESIDPNLHVSITESIHGGNLDQVDSTGFYYVNDPNSETNQPQITFNNATPTNKFGFSSNVTSQDLSKSCGISLTAEIYIDDPGVSVKKIITRLYTLISDLMLNRLYLCSRLASFKLIIKARKPCTQTDHYFTPVPNFTFNTNVIYNNTSCVGAMYSPNKYTIPESPDFYFNQPDTCFEQYVLGELELINN